MAKHDHQQPAHTPVLASKRPPGAKAVKWLTTTDHKTIGAKTIGTLYPVTHEVAVVRLNASGTAGRVIERRTDPRFDSPTTIARFGDRFYLPNARFGVPSPQTAEYTVVAIPR